jgi:hypothetical protein
VAVKAQAQPMIVMNESPVSSDQPSSPKSCR